MLNHLWYFRKRLYPFDALPRGFFGVDVILKMIYSRVWVDGESDTSETKS